MRNSLNFKRIAILCVISFLFGGLCQAAAKLKPLRVVALLDIGESKDVKLSNGKTVNLKLISVDEVRDDLRNAVRSATIKVSVDGKEVILGAGNYNLPVEVGKVQIDCPEVSGFYSNSNSRTRPITKKVNLRLWPKGSPYINPGTFVYPLEQAWFGSMTQSGNEPTYVDWGESAANKRIYYHSAHDMGGAEGMDQVVAATDGLVIGAYNKILAGYDTIPVFVHTDAVSVLDDRGWLVEYLHLDSTDPGIKLGERVKMGQKIGMIGKQGTSGGWCHLHFEIKNRENLTGNWNSEGAYAYVWEAYVRQYKPAVIAVARPHNLIWAGQEVTLDGSKSRSIAGKITSYEWTFTDGTNANGAVQKKKYDVPGEYSEILKVTDSKGNISYDFNVIQVIDKDASKAIPTIQPAFHPSLNIKAGDAVTFLVRTFNSDIGNEEWNFGDGTPVVKVKSEKVNKADPTKGKFAETVHKFSKAGHYVVSVERSNESGYKATGRLHVVIE
jgi:murein DD-endopeptidase MepM/ murein hydrolase activator NlpD